MAARGQSDVGAVVAFNRTKVLGAALETLKAEMRASLFLRRDRGRHRVGMFCLRNTSWSADAQREVRTSSAVGCQGDRGRETHRKKEDGEVEKWEEQAGKWEEPRRRSAKSRSWSAAIRLAENCAGI